MGKAISLLRAPQATRESESESERGMELRKRPRPPRVDPDFVSSPPPRKRARKQAAPLAPAPRPATRRRARCSPVIIQSPVAGLQPSACGPCEVPLRACRSPRVSFIAHRRRPFNWYEADMWTEVAKYLFGAELVRLSSTCRWFRQLLADEFIWRYAFLRDLSLLPASADLYPPCPPHRSWRLLYTAAFNGAHSYWFCQNKRHIGAYRIGGFLLESPHMLLTAMLALPRWLPPQEDGPQIAIEMTGACMLSNARPGIWIADFHLVHCPKCTINTCSGVLQVLDARHCELFLEEGFWNGTWEYEDLGDHYNDEETATAACAIFNASHPAQESASCSFPDHLVMGKKLGAGGLQDVTPAVHSRIGAVWHPTTSYGSEFIASTARPHRPHRMHDLRLGSSTTVHGSARVQPVQRSSLQHGSTRMYMEIKQIDFPLLRRMRLPSVNFHVCIARAAAPMPLQQV